ncbi:hypothetical protein [Nannocystis sp.]|uniref:hypothetical protein n=1 Tax=Nannocystis sp. TaxID=1962667 RepID=UPI002424EF33|nr:hypothetical protein [Nannocystis sp.]MBK7825770.1 hypothetical protein [Nannocystis sp.]MBK9757330.1 hypothetical protein [Nannocystis sp.]
MSEVRGRYGIQSFDGRWLRVDVTARTLWPSLADAAGAGSFYAVVSDSGELRLCAEDVQAWVRVGPSGLLLADVAESGATGFTNSLITRSDQPSFAFGVQAPGGRALRVAANGSGALTTEVGEADASSIIRLTSTRHLGDVAPMPGTRVTAPLSVTAPPLQPVGQLSRSAEQKLKRRPF